MCLDEEDTSCNEDIYAGVSIFLQAGRWAITQIDDNYAQYRILIRLKRAIHNRDRVLYVPLKPFNNSRNINSRGKVTLL